jgi:hypothetical protein
MKNSFMLANLEVLSSGNLKSDYPLKEFKLAVSG